MRIAVTYENGQVFQHFGHTETFKVYEVEDGKVISAEIIGSGTGYFCTGGKYVPINWSRADVNSPYSYTTEDGTPITFTPGKTYCAIIPLVNSSVEFS